MLVAALAGCGKNAIPQGGPSPEELGRIVQQQAALERVPPALILAIIQVESGGNPRAVSRTGAAGLMQLTAATARRYGARDPFDPASNVAAGARFLHDLLARYRGNLRLTLAAWNVGEGAVDFAKGVPPRAQAFVDRAMRAYSTISAYSAAT